MIKKLKNIKIKFVVLPLLLIVGFTITFSVAHAGTLTNILKDRLNRLKQSQTSGINHTVVFKTATAVSGGAGVNKVILQFPDGDDGLWCRSAAALTTGDCTEDSATALPGTQTAACTQGSGASSYDKITISAVNDLSSATTYCFTASDGAGALGTPLATTGGVVTVTTNNGTSDIDSGTLAIDIIADDQVTVSATVDPSITFTLSGNSISLGTLSTGSVSTGSMTVQTVTNALYGYSTAVLENNNLRIDVSNDVDDVGDGAVTAGAEEYGLATSDASQDISQDTSCGSAPYTASAITTSNQSVAGATSGPVDETSTLCFAASITSTTTAGTYGQTLTFVSTAKF